VNPEWWDCYCCSDFWEAPCMVTCSSEDQPHCPKCHDEGECGYASAKQEAPDARD
jgi:hypothetical protein